MTGFSALGGAGSATGAAGFGAVLAAGLAAALTGAAGRAGRLGAGFPAALAGFADFPAFAAALAGFRVVFAGLVGFTVDLAPFAWAFAGFAAPFTDFARFGADFANFAAGLAGFEADLAGFFAARDGLDAFAVREDLVDLVALDFETVFAMLLSISIYTEGKPPSADPAGSSEELPSRAEARDQFSSSLKPAVFQARNTWLSKTGFSPHSGLFLKNITSFSQK